ncbi:hypothetical protein [Falsiphaeobacter marinintestinus]|uniref:hypothetical protein n=1 Tax=Falsiphaeobacter marinintestinus TaxID=1492905 RepID=UPI0011B4B09F|nr:hypothetical protein [Phaeobacter marinintestinus]
MTVTGDRVFDGADLRATLFDPSGDKLIAQDRAFSTPSRARCRMTGVILLDPFRKLDMRNTRLIAQD